MDFEYCRQCERFGPMRSSSVPPRGSGWVIATNESILETSEALVKCAWRRRTHRLPPGGTDLIAPHVADMRIVQTASVPLAATGIRRFTPGLRSILANPRRQPPIEKIGGSNLVQRFWVKRDPETMILRQIILVGAPD
jgi:hypothetical protein